MRFSVKIIIPLLILSFSSCSFKNKLAVYVTIDSEPTSKIYIDDIYYGDTAKEISLVPDKNYNLRLVKDGYQVINYEMKTKFSMRKNRQEESSRCMFDLLGSVFVVPIMGLKSTYCRDFEKEIYSFELSPIYSYKDKDESYRQGINKGRNYTAEDNEQTNAPRMIFNSSSEFANDGNSAGFRNQNFDRKPNKINYYDSQ